jgi:hypothetical protein
MQRCHVYIFVPRKAAKDKKLKTTTEFRISDAVPGFDVDWRTMISKSSMA